MIAGSPSQLDAQQRSPTTCACSLLRPTWRKSKPSKPNSRSSTSRKPTPPRSPCPRRHPNAPDHHRTRQELHSLRPLIPPSLASLPRSFCHQSFCPTENRHTPPPTITRHFLFPHILFSQSPQRSLALHPNPLAPLIFLSCIFLSRPPSASRNSHPTLQPAQRADNALRHRAPSRTPAINPFALPLPDPRGGQFSS
jgi:hypothetical protein